MPKVQRYRMHNDFTVALRELGCQTQPAIARTLGIGLRTVHRYQAGRTKVPESIRRLIAMLSKYGIPPEWK